jgi:malate/lactate dehydrogenase
MGGLLDAQRFSLFLGKELKAKPKDVKSMVIGEHGESMVPLFSQSFYRKKAVKTLLTPEQSARVLEETRKAGENVIALKGATVFAPAMAIARMVDNIVEGKGEILPVSCMLRGEYGVSDVCTGVPAKLGRFGLEEIIQLELEQEEKAAFLQSAEKLKKVIAEIGM